MYQDVRKFTQTYQGVNYQVIEINRKPNRVKAKYFAYKEGNLTISERYNAWKKEGDKNIVLVSSAGYMDYYSHDIPEGLTIDNGNVVNGKLSNNYGGLVVNYNGGAQEGGIAVVDIKKSYAKIYCNGSQQQYNLNNSYDCQQYISCAKNMQATAFQTHLLAYDNILRVYNNGSSNKAERRFLAAAYRTDEDGERRLYHIIVNVPTAGTLVERTTQTYNFIKSSLECDEIIYMINLDTGMQNVYSVYDTNGNEDSYMKGTTEVKKAANLLVYYYD